MSSLLQPHWAHVNVRTCYAAFVEQFDTLHETDVVWEPYRQAALLARAPYFSALCFRDQAYWMTKEKLVYDVYVEDHSPHRVMRQFGLFQEFPPRATDVTNRAAHK